MLKALVVVVCSACCSGQVAGQTEQLALLQARTRVEIAAQVDQRPEPTTGLIATHIAVAAALPSSHAQQFLHTDALQLGHSSAAPTCAKLTNQGSYFTLSVEVGTSVKGEGIQRFDLVADTGSDSVIVRSCACKNCKYSGNTRKEDRVCFQGTNRSSSFNLIESHGNMNVMHITFGSGTVQAVVASDLVSLGSLTANLEGGLLLMVNEQLKIAEGIQGIFGLGPPRDRTVKTVKDQREDDPSGSSGRGFSIEDLLRGMLRGAKRGGGVVIPMGAMPPMSGLGNSMPTSALFDGNSIAAFSDESTVHQVSWLEKAHVNRFSMCFGGDDKGNGRLTLNSPEAAKKLPSIGKMHWSLNLAGITVATAKTGLNDVAYVNPTPVGKASAPLCTDKAEQRGANMNCGAIPDSGTTLITAGKEHVQALLETVCSQWDRCQKNVTALSKARDAAVNVSEQISKLHDPFGLTKVKWSPSLVMKLLLADCDRWLPKEHDKVEAFLNQEMPAVQFHLQVKENDTQLIELKPWHYVLETTLVNKSQKDSGILDKTALKLLQEAKPQAAPNRVCSAAFGEMEYTTKENGPIWIMGTPLFYAYEVGYQLKPATMSFTQKSCAPCEGGKPVGHSLVAQDSDVSQRATGRALRRIDGQPRLPRVDPSQPL